MTQFCRSKKRQASEATLVAAFAVCLCTLVAAVNHPHPDGGEFKKVRVPLTRLVHTYQDRIQAPQVTYFGAIRIGNPQKVYGVLFDTGTSETWLPHYSQYPIDMSLHCSVGIDCQGSSTCVSHKRDSKIDYRGTSLWGKVYEDTVTIYADVQRDDKVDVAKPHTSFRQNFLAATNASDEQFRWKAYDGVIGLAPVTQSSSGIKNWLLSMQSRSPQIKDHGNVMHQSDIRLNPSNSASVFSIWLNPIQDARYGGEIMFGGVDENRYLGEIFFHRINSWFDWQLPVNGVQLGKHLISCANGCNAILETGVNPLIGPRKDVEKIYSQSQAHYDNDSELWLVDCERIEHLSTLVFQIDSTPYKLHPHQYIKRFNFRDQAICHMAIKSWDQPNWVLGNDFIGAYYTVFDLEHRRVGFATSRS